MAIDSDFALLETVRHLVAELEVGGEREWARRLAEALGGSLVSSEGKEGIRSVLRRLRSAEAATRLGLSAPIGDALRYLDLILGQEPQY